MNRIKTLYRNLVLILLTISSLPSYGQLQQAVVQLYSDRIQLIDGTNINWGAVTQSSIRFDQIDAGVNGQITLHFNSTPSTTFKAKLFLTPGNADAFLEISGTTLKDAEGNTLETGLTSGQVLSILRCGENRSYFLDGNLIHLDEIPANDILQGKLEVEEASGEAIYFSIDEMENVDCDFSIPSHFIPPALALKACVDNNPGNETPDGIYLRWVLPDYLLWQEGNKPGVGYKIDRYTISVDGLTLEPADRLLSKETSGPFQPLTQSEWDIMGTNAAMIAKGVLYSEDPVLDIPTDPNELTLVHAVTSQSSLEGRYTFALVAADQDFSIAEGLALGYYDNTAIPGEEYVYRVSMNTDDNALKHMYNYAVASLDNIEVLPAPEIIQVVGKDLRAEITWEVQSLEDIYSSYDILRLGPLDNDFVKVNNTPFYSLTQADAVDDGEATFIDILPTNGEVYLYKIEARTPFGMKGPGADQAEVTGRPDRLDFELTMEQPAGTESVITLTWPLMDASLQSQMTGYQIYYAETPDGEYEGLLENLLANNTTSYDLISPAASGYYSIACWDANGYIYRSIPTLGQLMDETPPAIPIGLIGQFISPIKVRLLWDPVPDSDLMGYKVFMANMPDGHYTQLTSALVSNEEYYYEVDPTFMVDHIYFRVAAADLHDNCSDWSAFLELERPDLIAPAMPSFFKAEPNPVGIALGWKFSSSEDVVRHEIQRKKAHLSISGWSTILTIPKESEDQYENNLDPTGIVTTCYLDTITVDGFKYQYRILAYDEADNVTSSEVFTVTPFDNKKKATIENFIVEATCTADPSILLDPSYLLIEELIAKYDTTQIIDTALLASLAMHEVISNTEFNDLMSQSPAEIYTFLLGRKVQYFNSQLSTSVIISWLEPNDDNLVDYELYRSVDGSAIMPYKIIAPEMLTGSKYYDEEVIAGHRYIYQVLARYKGGATSPLSDTKMVKIPNGI
ncbi:MAG: fibronectin type III domain-containing protein [Saprospiraceae bacterium]|nr:fibronectin type III domain-containing protein [Saprospiraceae bacterium]